MSDVIIGQESSSCDHENVPDIHDGDMISRQAAIEAVRKLYIQSPRINNDFVYDMAIDQAHDALVNLPSAQPERDIPIKPIETADRAWGIPKRQAVCPKCDYYLGHIAYLGDYKGKRMTYCEQCGQAIDWEGWDFDDE